MKFNVALLFFVIALITFTQGLRLRCGANEVFISCASGCECPDLDKYCDPRPFTAQNCPDICPRVCIETCICAPDFFRHRNGKCVKTC